ncbi:MAG: dihydrofolate reductase [Caulobacteraceae bacterium]|nr:MAG: dihydrofolate reductase [Caulobacteraceae bacterium]
MARLVFGMNQSLDGYVDHDSPAFASSAPLFQHYIEQTRGLAASLYGRRLYELMRYWDEDGPAWGEAEHAFAQAWRGTPKWVVSNTLKSVGPNARLLEGDLATAVRQLKDRLEGEIEVGGPVLAGSLTELGLIDEYRLYVHPVVLGQGAPFFTGPRPPLRLLSSERIDGSILRLAYVPA